MMQLGSHSTQQAIRNSFLFRPLMEMETGDEDGSKQHRHEQQRHHSDIRTIVATAASQYRQKYQQQHGVDSRSKPALNEYERSQRDHSSITEEQKQHDISKLVRSITVQPDNSRAALETARHQVSKHGSDSTSAVAAQSALTRQRENASESNKNSNTVLHSTQSVVIPQRQVSIGRVASHHQSSETRHTTERESKRCKTDYTQQQHHSSTVNEQQQRETRSARVTTTPIQQTLSSSANHALVIGARANHPTSAENNAAVGVTVQCGGCHNNRDLASFYEERQVFKTCLVCRRHSAKYHAEHREAIALKRKQAREYSNHVRHACPCGSIVRMLSKNSHEKSKRHRMWIAAGAVPIPPPPIVVEPSHSVAAKT